MKSATMAETMIRENKQNKSEMMMVVGSSCHGTDKRTCPDKFRHVCAMYWSAHVILCRNRSLKWKAVLYILLKFIQLKMSKVSSQKKSDCSQGECFEFLLGGIWRSEQSQNQVSAWMYADNVWGKFLSFLLFIIGS